MRTLPKHWIFYKDLVTCGHLFFFLIVMWSSLSHLHNISNVLKNLHSTKWSHRQELATVPIYFVEIMYILNLIKKASQLLSFTCHFNQPPPYLHDLRSLLGSPRKFWWSLTLTSVKIYRTNNTDQTVYLTTVFSTWKTFGIVGMRDQSAQIKTSISVYSI